MNIIEKARFYRRKIEAWAETQTDEEAVKTIDLYPVWHPDTDYAVDDRRRYGSYLYKCLQAHTSQAAWTPDAAPSLWVRVDDPAEEWPEWRQPTGATDAYALGAKVSHVGKHWISDVDNNVWEPGVPGTETLWHEVTE